MPRTLLRILLALLLSATALAQPAVPTTPAGKVFSAWLDAFNSADPVKVRAFDEAHRREAPPLQQTLGLRDQTGGFTLLRVEKSEPTAIVALVQERGSDTVGRVEITVGPEDPPRIVEMSLRAVPRPPDLAIPRLGEADALAAVSRRIDELAGEDRFSGVLLIARQGRTLLQKTVGLADREARTPVTAETRFRIGSMNKMFTATAILQLVEGGRVALDDALGKHLPDYPNEEVASKVTVRHLLTHTGGTGDIFGPEFSARRLTLRDHGDYLELYGARGPLHEPGSEFRYSNYGFVLLGAIIEKVTGTSYYDHVRAKVFQPAGMRSTDSLPESEAVGGRSIGYMRRGGAWVPNADTLPWRGTAAGGGYSTAGDLLRFAQALESGTLLSKALLAQATSVQRERYGFGFDVRGDGRLRNYGHGGGAPGMNGELRVFPEQGLVIVGLANLDPPAASRAVSYYTLRMPDGT
jgi:CubicO group peptidase (beta-lactamase class C family)